MSIAGYVIKGTGADKQKRRRFYPDIYKKNTRKIQNGF